METIYNTDETQRKSSAVASAWDKLVRDAKDLPLRVVVRKAFRYVDSLALSGLYLRACTKVGRGARCRGRPYIENLGQMVIGDDFNLVSLFVQSHLATGPNGNLVIGDSVNINFGAAISANEHLNIGSRTRIGPYVIIADSDYHSAKDRDKRPTAPIYIGDDVWLASRVVVLKGARIGAGSVITAGSVVSGDIPAGVIAGGVPTRVLRSVASTERTELDFTENLDGRELLGTEGQVAPEILADELLDTSLEPQPALVESVSEVVAKTFQLSDTPDTSWGPREIPRWDSLGHLQLANALEARFGVSLSERHLMRMTNVAQVARVMGQCLLEAERK